MPDAAPEGTYAVPYPATPVGTPVGAETLVAVKSTELADAEATSATSRSLAFEGTVERKPMRGGSTDGWVKFP